MRYPLLPESPRHLAKAVRLDEARDILEGYRVNLNIPELNQEI